MTYTIFGSKKGENNIDSKYLAEIKNYIEGSKKIDGLDPI